MKNIQYSLLLVITAAIWGFSFVAQKEGMEHIGPFTFNGIRFLLGSVSLLPLYFFSKKEKQSNLISTIQILKYGISLGTVLFLAASLQQIGMIYTSAANGGFITSLYVLLVPVMGLFLGKRVKFHIWIGAIIAVFGLYFLSIGERFELQTGDSLVLTSAIFWALHLILIERYVLKMNVILLAIMQFSSTAILSLIVAFIYEELILENILAASVSILYAGIASVGIAYTLQIFAQRKVAAEQAAIILSFESAFAMLGGWLLLGEQHGLRAIFGAALMLGGIILSQINFKSNEKTPS